MTKQPEHPLQRRHYILLSILLFAIEFIIAVFFRDSFIRPIFGDFLVVILLYCMVRSLGLFSIYQVAIGVLLFAWGLEFLQWINILDILGIKRNIVTAMLLGSTFDWWDMLAYLLGIISVLLIEHWIKGKTIHTEE